jgi:two-component system, LytTR family, sensor kinase
LNKYIKIVIHLIFWTVYMAYSIPVSFQAARPLHIMHLMPHLVINTIWAVIAFYTFYALMITYFEKKKYIRYLLFSIGICVICSAIFFPLHLLVSTSSSVIDLRLIIGSTIGTFILGQCGSLVRGFEYWIENQQRHAEIENQYLRAENELLKSQVSPHFLFNTLNNIDSFIHSQPQKASETLISLSEILRYMIYETKAEFVPLSKEIEYLRNYIQLQKVRLVHAGAIKVVLSENCDNLTIAPLLFLPFVENAFKHATSTDEANAIEISILCSDNHIIFHCANKYTSGEKKQGTNGFGLENVKRRLELLYKNKYQLTMNKTLTTFEVNLIIRAL